MEGNLINFRYGTPVTIDPLYPELEPGTFSFDYETLALYLDTDTRRVQVMDPLKLSLSGGAMTGDLTVENGGTVVASISSETGVIQGQYLETTGSIHLDVAPRSYAVIDDNGRIRTRTKAEMIQDLGIISPATLGALAFKDSASGSYTPQGTISAPSADIALTSGPVVRQITPGELPSFTVRNEALELSEGTQTTAETTEVVLHIDSVTVGQPEFTGVTATITVD